MFESKIPLHERGTITGRGSRYLSIIISTSADALSIYNSSEKSSRQMNFSIEREPSFTLGYRADPLSGWSWAGGETKEEEN